MSDVRPSQRWSLSGKLAVLLAGFGVVVASVAAAGSALGLSPWWAWLATVAILLPLAVVLASRVSRSPQKVLAALRDGVEGFRSGDFSVRLGVERHDELGQLVAMYNRVGEVLRNERSSIRQRELLLETVVESSPAAIVLVGHGDRIVIANRVARRLFFAGRPMEGWTAEEAFAGAPEPLRQALAAGRDALVSLPVGDQATEPETFHVTRRVFDINARHHLLLMVRHMTPELRRQEVAVWKKVIRVIGHEINNSLAPIQSLVHSARQLHRRPDAAERLDGVFDTIEECTGRLQRFVDGYATFARLPEPRKEPVSLVRLLHTVRQLEPFETPTTVPECTLRLDPSQIQQVLINLTQNAREAGSDPDEIAVEVLELPSGEVALRVLDRGSGMAPEILEQAVLPYFTTKSGGTGLGLALSREIVEAHGGTLQLESRSGGGVVVTCRLPRE